MAQSQSPKSIDPRLAGLSPQVVAKVESAKLLLQHRDAASAERALRGALAMAGNHAEVLRLLGMSLRLQDRNADALIFMRRAAAQNPDDPLIQNGLATALDACGESDAAVVAFRRTCELAPQVPQFWSNYGKALSDRGLFKEAIEPLERAVAMSSGDAAHLRLAYALRVLGRTDEAAQRYRDLIARNRNDGDAWLGLSDLKTRKFSDDDLQALRQIWHENALDIDNRISMGFALSRALDDHAQFAESLRVLDEANALTRSIRPWSHRDFAEQVERVLEAFATPPQGARNGQGGNVIFIVSMPRSGSSLTEQILASHPLVDGAGELMEISGVIQEESQRLGVPFPQWVAQATPEDWERLGSNYLQRTQQWQTRVLFTDKLPDNWVRIGAAMAMLPGARVVDCRRDPVETCFSCYRNLFMQGTQAFTYDIHDLAAYYGLYARATDQWHRNYGTRFRRQQYEALIAHPHAQIAELLEFCGLPYDAACERFYETERVVQTASSAQVREPLMRDTARASKYGALLDPLRDALKSQT